MVLKEQTSGLGPPIKKRQSAQPPPQQAAAQHNNGHHAGVHPEDSSGNLTVRQPANRTQARKQPPAQTTEEYEQLADDVEEDEYDDVWPPRMPTSSRRYTPIPGDDVVTFTQGGRRYIVHNTPPPQQRSQRGLPPPRHQYFEEEPEIIPQRRRFHPLVWVGIAIFIMIFGWFFLTSLGSWVQTKEDDWTYGQVRHFTTDAVVGHNDSSSSPSHFIAENNNGNIHVIELPGGDSTKAKIYPITEVTGNQGNPPVRLVFQDINRDGKLDMIVQIGDTGSAVTIMLFNNGSQFVSKL